MVLLLHAYFICVGHDWSPLSHKSSFFPSFFFQSPIITPQPSFSGTSSSNPIAVQAWCLWLFLRGRTIPFVCRRQFCPLHISDESPASFIPMCDTAFDCCEFPCYYQVLEIVSRQISFPIAHASNCMQYMQLEAALFFYLHYFRRE